MWDLLKRAIYSEVQIVYCTISDYIQLDLTVLL